MIQSVKASSPAAPAHGQRPHILIVGGGYVGLYTALRLQRRLRRGEASVTVVDPEPTMTYQPFLAEAAAGSLEARHLVVPLRQVLRRCRVLTGRVSAVDRAAKVATVRLANGATAPVAYDQLVLAPGSVSRTLPIPGLAERGFCFKTVGEAVALRNRVLGQLDLAASTPDPLTRRRALSFVVVGGGYAGIEALAELEDLARDALRLYPALAASDLRWVLAEATQRVLPEVSETLGRYTLEQLRRRNIEVKLDTVVESLVGGQVVFSDGSELAADTVIWTAGVRANVLAAECGLPVDAQGRLACTAELRVKGLSALWSAGDCAAVPDLSRRERGVLCTPSAQHAVRQAKTLADNLIATLRAQPLTPYLHRNVGSVASLGLYRGVAEVYGVRLRGLPAWLLHRAYHLSLLPTFGQKVRVAADWGLALLLGRELSSLEQVQRPRDAWAAGYAAIPGERAAAHPDPVFDGEPTGAVSRYDQARA